MGDIVGLPPRNPDGLEPEYYNVNVNLTLTLKLSYFEDMTEKTEEK